MNTFKRQHGAHALPNGNCEFFLWAPTKNKIDLITYHEQELVVPMQPAGEGFWKTVVENITAGTAYHFLLDDKQKVPDPAALSQPGGGLGPSVLVDRNFNWDEGTWNGIHLNDVIIYELHVGTFTSEGSFDAVAGRLEYLKDLGITAIEIMPVGQFPGTRNWGYDGMHPYAVQDSYGGVAGLKRLVNAAHRLGIAVILDVVYNHIGPDGYFLHDIAPYFTEKYKTPWGSALNYDDAWCDGVREYLLQNILMWLDEFRIDGLRMDAVHAIWDFSASHIMELAAERVRALEQETGRKKLLIAELDLNNPRYINPRQQGGYGLDGQWVDEFHHALHSLLTGDRDGYYEDFGSIEHLEKAFRNTYVYDGNYSIHRKKNSGRPVNGNPYSQFVVFTQNHDQVGNRVMGDRLTATLSFEQLKLAGAAMLLSPYVPMLFMGEEYGEENPFYFFVDHKDPSLVEAVREGRRKEFSYFKFEDDFPDPQDIETFQQSSLSWLHEEEGHHRSIFMMYRELIHLRKTHPALQGRERENMFVHPSTNNMILFERSSGDARALIVLHFGSAKADYCSEEYAGFERIFDSSSSEWGGQTALRKDLIDKDSAVVIEPMSAVLFISPNNQ